MEYRNNEPGLQQQSQDDDHNLNADFNLVPPPWFEQMAPPPIGVDDDDAEFEREWLPLLDDDGSAPKYFVSDQAGDKPLLGVLWQGRQWAVSARGVEKRDGTYTIPFSELWTTIAIKAAVAAAADDPDDLKEALRLGRRLDCHFDLVWCE